MNEDNKTKLVNEMKILSSVVGPRLDVLSKLKDIYSKKKE